MGKSKTKFKTPQDKVTKPSNAQHNPILGSNLIPNNMSIISHYANDLIEISTHALQPSRTSHSCYTRIILSYLCLCVFCQKISYVYNLMPLELFELPF